MTKQASAVFQEFVQEVRNAWAAGPDTELRMKKTKPILEKLLQNPELQSNSESWPSTEGRKNLLLYTDPDYGFVVNAVVRAPGRKGNIHDHAQAWVLYGLLAGTESLERFERLDDGSKPGYAEVRLESVTTGGPGKVDLVPPLGIHAEQGGAGRSVAVIVRSEVLVGRVLQHGYDMQAKTVIERSGPTQVPFEINEASVAA